MTAKQYLQQVKGLDNMIEAKLEQVERLRALATRVTTSFSHDKQGKGAARHEKTADIVCKIVMLEEKLNASIDTLVDLKAEVEEKIDEIPNDNYRLLLRLRYLNYKTWEDIASTIGYTPQWIYITHGRALQEFQKKFQRIDES